MDPLLVVSLLVCAAGGLQAGLMLLHAWEHRRYHRSRLTTELRPSTGEKVTLIVPCKGMDLELRSNLRPLFEQSYEPYELCFVVESLTDPAVAVIDELRKEFPQRPSRLVAAGLATDSGQKVHNLMCATASSPKTGQILAFVDSDASPHRDWLSRLVDRLHSGKHAVTTGYRWYRPVQPTWANRFLSAINNTVIGVLGPHGFNLIWGGAWAIRVETFHALGLPQAWSGSLSDDLVVSRLVHEAGLKVAYEPHCLVCSPADFTWGGLYEFLRRQYLVTRVYAPRWWRFAIATSGLTNLVMWGLPALALMMAVRQGPWFIPAGGAVLLYLLGAARQAIGAGAIRPFIRVSNQEYDLVARVAIWRGPVVSLLVGLGLVGSAVGRTIVWRGIKYHLDSPSQTRIQRPPESSTSHREVARAA